MNEYKEILYRELRDIIPYLKSRQKGYKENFKQKVKDFKNFYIIWEIEYLWEFVNPKYKINIDFKLSTENFKQFVLNELKDYNLKDFNYSSFIQFISFIDLKFEKDFNKELLKRYFIITEAQKIKTLNIFTFRFNK